MPFSKSFFPVSQYKPAKIQQSGTEVYIVFYAENDCGKLQRKKIRVNRIMASAPNAKAAKKRLEEMCADINSRLALGWSPFISAPEDKIPSVFNLVEAANRWLQEKKKEVRPDTLRCYSSFCHKFIAYIKTECPHISPNQCSKLIAVRFLDTQYLTMESPRSYNNMLKLGRTLFSWLCDHGYAEVNPFAEINVKKTYAKKRQLIPPAARELITSYLRENDPVFLLYLKLIFTSLIRPKEIRELQVRDIVPAECRIIIRPEVAKTHEERSCLCPPDLILDLVKTLHIECRKPDELLFYGNSKGYYLRRWQKLREELNLPDTYQMYSFRDTGITEYLRSGVDTLTVMQLAGHSDLSITSIYARHADNSLYLKMANKALEF